MIRCGSFLVKYAAAGLRSFLSETLKWIVIVCRVLIVVLSFCRVLIVVLSFCKRCDSTISVGNSYCFLLIRVASVLWLAHCCL